MIHFPCFGYMTTRFCYLFINYFIMLINFLLFFNSYIAQNRSIYQYNTRGKLHVNLYLNTPHSNFGKILLKYKGSVLWNNLPEKLKFTENTTTFKKLLTKYITECVD